MQCDMGLMQRVFGVRNAFTCSRRHGISIEYTKGMDFVAAAAAMGAMPLRSVHIATSLMMMKGDYEYTSRPFTVPVAAGKKKKIINLY
mmetsp:Transcript_27147/g.43664  ORF Transcript_27147/g.43664 Transcript_27147/m.43664 type:complete len:88 (-) Transcript_27147:557-820(-)